MPFNIAAWKAQGLVYGGARPTLFSVFLAVPPALGIDNVSVNKFRFVCTSAGIPDFEVGKIDVGYFGRMIKVAGDRMINDWEVNIYNDEDYSVRSLFEKWSNGINRLVSNVRDPNLSMEEYKVDLEVEQYSKDGSIIRSYRAVGAWPTMIGRMELDWNSQNQIQTFPVTFSVDYFEPVIESTDKKAGGVNVYGPDSIQDGPLGPS